MFTNVTFRLFSVFFFFFFPSSCKACAILVPSTGMGPMFPALEVQSLHHWISREALFWFLIQTLDWQSHDLLLGEKWQCQESLSHIFTSSSLESPLPCRLTFWLKTVKCYLDLFSESCYLSFFIILIYFTKGFFFLSSFKKNTCKKIINMTIPKLKAPDIGDIIKTLKINMGVSV